MIALIRQHDTYAKGMLKQAAGEAFRSDLLYPECAIEPHRSLRCPAVAVLDAPPRDGGEAAIA
jgi:hypothetical protein